MRAMVATLTLSGVLTAGLGAMVVTAATAQDAPAETPPVGAGDEALIDRLVELERGLPALPPSAAVVVDTETFGQLEGDFLGALTELELISDQARQLFIDADSADGAIADAVAVVSRGYLRLEQAYVDLAAFEDYDLARPLGATDGSGVATGADTAATFVESGLALVDLARMDALFGYAVLRDSEAADDAEKALFDAAYRDTQAYLTTIRPEAATLVSASSTALLLAVERFDGAGAGEARAKDVTYVCIPRELYPLDAPDPAAALASLVAGEELAQVPTGDCPDLPSPENQVTTLAG